MGTYSRYKGEMNRICESVFDMKKENCNCNACPLYVACGRMYRATLAERTKLFAEAMVDAYELHVTKQMLLSEYGSSTMALIEEYAKGEVSSLALASEIGSSGMDFAKQYAKLYRKIGQLCAG